MISPLRTRRTGPGHPEAKPATGLDGLADRLRTRYFIVHNPNAGSETRRFYDAVLASLRHTGGYIEIVETARHGDGGAAAAAASGRFDAVVAAGGDGTVHDVAAGLLDGGVPLGVIPLGTANVFAREIGLPGSPAALAEMLCRGPLRTIPVGLVNGRPFLFVVGVGFDAEAVRHFETAGSRRFGKAGLVEPVLRALVSHRDRPLRVETDDDTVEARWVIVTRTKRYAANLMLAPDADIGDARLHVLCMKGSGPFARFTQLAALVIGCLRYAPGVTLKVASRVRIEGGIGVPVQIDGEMLGTLPLDMRIHSKTLQIISP